jgi:hypothetical protein
MSNQFPTIEALEQARDAAREAVANHPHQAKVEELRSQIVKLQTSGTLTEEKLAQLATLVAERETLQGEQHRPLQEAQRALTVARRGARAAADGRLAESLLEFSVEQLESKRDQLAAERKKLKRQQRAVAIALSAKHQEAELQKQLAAFDAMTPEQKARLRTALS